MAEDESESQADVIRKSVSILGRPTRRRQAPRQSPLSTSASAFVSSSLGVPAAAVGQGGSGSARTNTSGGSAVGGGYNPPPPYTPVVPAAPLTQPGSTSATTPGTRVVTETEIRSWTALLLSCILWALSFPLRVVQSVKAYLLSIIRSFLFTLAKVYISIYICIYLFQRGESTYTPPPALGTIGIKSGLFTGYIHEYVCWPLTVPVQVPGFKICPSQPVFFFLPSTSSPDKVSRDVNSGDGTLGVEGKGSSPPHWALDNRASYRGPWAYATLENVDAAFNSNGTCSSRESIADIRHAAFQTDIRFWEDKERAYKSLCADMLAYLADDKIFRAAVASENPRRSSSSFLDIYTQVNAVRVLVGRLIEQLRGLDSMSVEFESVIVPAINTPRPPTTHPRVDVHSPWWQFWSDWGGERRAQEARKQAEKEYVYMMRSLRQILEDLDRLVEKANAVFRELEGLEGGGVREVSRLVALAERERRAERKAEQRRDMAGQWSWSGLEEALRGAVRRARMWMPLFFAVDEDAAVLEEEDIKKMTAHRACEMLLLVRVKELSAKTARSLVYFNAMLKSRRVETTELSRYTTEEGLEAVKSGHLGLSQHFDRLLLALNRRYTDQVRERRAIMKAMIDDGDEIREKSEE